MVYILEKKVALLFFKLGSITFGKSCGSYHSDG